MSNSALYMYFAMMQLWVLGGVVMYLLIILIMAMNFVVFFKDLIYLKCDFYALAYVLWNY